MTRFALALMPVALLAAAPAAQDSQQLDRLYREATLAQADGDCTTAARQFAAVAEAADRALAARALLKLAECSGDGDAQRVYRRIESEFGDQSEAADLARRWLELHATASSGVSAPPRGPARGPSSQVVWTAATSPRGTSSGTLSPDGRFFSYSDGADILVHELATGLDRNVTQHPRDAGGKQSGTAYESVIAPDGTQIAYIWYDFATQKYSLRLANLTGEPNPRTLYDNPDLYDLFLYDWSSHNGFLALVLQHTDKTTQIALLSSVDGSLHIVRSLGWAEVDGIRFSPDGTHLAYDRTASDLSSAKDIFVFVLEYAGGVPGVLGEVPAVEHDADDRLIGWSPDGQWLVFSSDRGGTTQLWAAGMSQGRPRGEPRVLPVAPAAGGVTAIGWIASGGLYYQARHVLQDPSMVRLATLDPVTPSEPHRTLGTRGHLEDTKFPVWSPDGRRLVYLSDLRGSVIQAVQTQFLVVYDVDAATSREVKPEGLRIDRPLAWSAEGRSILVRGHEPRAGTRVRHGIHRLDVTTGHASAISLFGPHPPFYGLDAWLPDGRSFVTAWEFEGGIERVDAATGAMESLVPNGTSSINTNPVLSPDGTRLFYRRALQLPDGSNMVEFVERDLGTGAERAIISRPELGDIHLSPDGDYIATTSTDPTDRARLALLVATKGGEVRELLRVSVTREEMEARGPVFRPVVGVPGGGWSADSRSILLWKSVVDPPSRVPGAMSETEREAHMMADGRRQQVEMWVASVDGGPATLHHSFRVESVQCAACTLDVSPDWRHFVYQISGGVRRTSEVILIENFLPLAAN